MKKKERKLNEQLVVEFSIKIIIVYHIKQKEMVIDKYNYINKRRRIDHSLI